MSEFYPSKRAIVAFALSLGLLAVAIAETNDSDGGINHYIQNAPSPHSQNGSIPEGKVFPPDAMVWFQDGTADYQAPADIAANTGLLEVTAFCGNPIDKRDPQNLYVSMSVRKEDGQVWGVMAGIAAAAACADGTISEADRPTL